MLAAIVSGLLGWFAARKGLAPPRAMKTQAVVVTGPQPGQRTPVEAVPIEMPDLALELNQMPDRLEDAFRRLSEFASDLAHELAPYLALVPLTPRFAAFVDSIPRGEQRTIDFLVQLNQRLQGRQRRKRDAI